MFDSIKKFFGKKKKKNYNFQESINSESPKKGLFDPHRWERLNNDIDSLSKDIPQTPENKSPPDIEQQEGDFDEKSPEGMAVPNSPAVAEDDIKDNTPKQVEKEPEIKKEVKTEKKIKKLKLPIRIKKIRKPHAMDVGNDPDWFYLDEEHKNETS